MTSTRTKTCWKISDFVAHASNINCLVLSPSNGRLLATGGDDRKINLWSPGKPNNVLSISGITSPVQSVAFNNAENWIGAGSKSGVIKVFDLDEKKTVRTISGHKSAVSSLDFHRFGEILATGSADTNLKIWDVRRKGCIFTYKGHTDSIDAVQFSPDGKWVASASSDHTVKIWDLSAGRLVADFRAHSGPVSSLQFHPKEFLLVTGSGDRTAKLWDLERFEVVSELPPESNAIRCVLFHLDGSVLFTGSQESLRVHGWEPAVTHDALPVHWGKLADMAISGDQLIGASFSQTNATVWCVDLKYLRPFSKKADPSPPIQSAPSDPPLTASRRRFEYNELPYERPPTQAGGQPVEDKPETGEDSPTVDVKDEERKKIFLQCQKLVRTPPKEIRTPFNPPDSPPKASHNKPINQSHPVPAIPSGHNVVNQFSHEGRQYKDFDPPKPVVMGGAKSPENRVIGEIVTNHSDVCQILKSRLSIGKSARESWSSSDPKAALETVINSGNQSALVDMLKLLHLKRTLWTLDMAAIVLPELRLLLKSKYNIYVVCGCNIIKLILKNFGPVIKSNLSLPPSSGVDITREERYKKCLTCHSHLNGLREDIHCLMTEPKSSKLIRDQAIVNAFSVLD